jgi:uncharacterized repeat protein (TIGR03803 family)
MQDHSNRFGTTQFSSRRKQELEFTSTGPLILASILVAALSGCGGGQGANSYAIGGTVQGLPEGSKLTLRNNGSDTLTLTASGAFSFDDPVPAGAGYAVAVVTQPVGQTCVVKDGSGSGVMTRISTVSVTCSTVETILHSFGSGTDGSQPGQLIQARDGNFYGVTAAGGANGNGTVFKITPSGVETVLYSFSASGVPDGRNPIGGLVEGGDGNFYGLTAFGGIYQVGVLFMVTPSGTQTYFYSFGRYSTDGKFPTGSLVLGTDGNFYGTTSGGGTGGIDYANPEGTVFQITPLSAEKILYSFSGAQDNDSSPVSLMQAKDGNFYGTTLDGEYGAGTVFTITPQGAVTVLGSFGAHALDGQGPIGELIEGTDGNFYGTTMNGGSTYTGTLFRVTPAGVITYLYDFEGDKTGTYGSTPMAGLIQANDGNFYGTTALGGQNNTGIIYHLSLSGVVSTLYSFGPSTGTDGARPAAPLVQATDGSLYGTTLSGGEYQQSNGPPLGTVFKIN